MSNDDTETSGQIEVNMSRAHACAVEAILTALRRVLLCVSVDESSFWEARHHARH